MGLVRSGLKKEKKYSSYWKGRKARDASCKISEMAGNINNFKCSICCWVSGSNIDFLNVPECSFSGTFFGHDQIETSQE